MEKNEENKQAGQDNFGRSELKNYHGVRQLGEGAYGVVYQGVDNRTQETIALKKIKLDTQSEGVPSTTIREISVLREIDHPNVVQLKDVVMCPNKMYLIFEYLEMDLKKKIDSLGPGNIFSSADVKSYLFQLLAGIAACHKCRIIHRDLKPQNILLGKANELKIADFGLARAFGIPIRPYTKEVVTLWYRAPELLLGAQEYSTPVDIWSAGCIFAEMVTKRALFDGDNDNEQIQKIFRLMGTPTEERWPGVTSLPQYKAINWPLFPQQDLKKEIRHMDTLDDNGLDLLYQMLEYDPTARISAVSALKHSYFADVKVPS